MNHLRVNGRVLAQNIFHKKACIIVVAQQKRNYRFGRQVTQSGFYINPTWFDQNLLKNADTTNSDAATSAKGIVKNEGLISKANQIFEEEKKRQQSLVTRIEKIEIQLEKTFPQAEDCLLMMNRGISTPYDCALHISQLVRERSAVAVVNGNHLWHMHQPLTETCHLRLLHFKHDDTMPANYAFWRSCSMLLGSVVRRAFKEQYFVQILSQPSSADITSGSFVCDVRISNLTDWNPSSEELRALTSMLWDTTQEASRFERLEVSAEIAAQLFADNPVRLSFLESEHKNNDRDKFVVYRVGDHIELCDEPLIANTDQIGSIYVSAIHPLKTSNGDQFYRFQGIALPRQLKINAYAFSLIRDRAKKLNRVGLAN